MQQQKMFQVAVLQQDIVWEDPVANFRHVEKVFDEALSGQNCRPDLMVMPETFTTGFGDQMARQAEQAQGATYTFVRSLAQKYDAMVAATWTVKEDGLIYNRLHLVSPDGLCNYYDKAHTFRMSSEASQLARGCRQPIVEWRGWRIRPAVCYDLRFPIWLRNTATLDYDLLLVCANWPGSRHEAWSTLLKARAIENLAYVVGCNRVGIDGTGIEYAGCSAVIDYKGLSVSTAPVGEEAVIVATLDADRLATFRSHWPFNLDFDN